LKDLLYRQVRAVRDELLKGKGKVSSAQMASLEHLMRLVQIHDAARPPRKRWPVVALLALVPLTVSVLLFLRVSKTDIELDLEVSGVGFRLQTTQVVTDVMEVPALGACGLEAIHIPRARGHPAQTLSHDANVIRLSSGDDGERHGTVTLAALTMPAGTRVWVRHVEGHHPWRLTVKGDSPVIRAAVHGPVRLEVANAPVEQRDFGTPKTIWLQAGPHEVDVDLRPSGPRGMNFRPQLAVNDLAFVEDEQYADEQRTLLRRRSTILSGEVYFNELNGRKRSLRPGEMIQFEKSTGELRTVQWLNDRIAIKFHGSVVAMRTGAGKSQWSLMPTCLEWLQARYALALLWGTTLYVFSLILGVLRWWEARP
jgi:hypothetical protein